MSEYKTVSTTNAEIHKCGSLNEAGIINSLKRQGFNLDKCIMELVANSIDAGANSILFTVERDFICIIDNGRGMTKKVLDNMFDLFRENHLGDKSMGISGLGGKAATCILSKQNDVTIYTFNAENTEGDYLKAFCPWGEIFASGKYIGNIIVNTMDNKEIAAFNNCIDGHSGTIIKINYNQDFADRLDSQFSKNPLADATDYMDLISFVFGRFPDVTIKYKHFDQDFKTIQKYNYFDSNLEDNSYYKHKTYDITLYFKEPIKEYKFILDIDNDKYEITKKGNGYSKTPTKHSDDSLRRSIRGYEEIGTFDVITGQRYDPSVFDQENPISLKNLHKRFNFHHGDLHCQYDKDTLESPNISEPLFNYLIKNALVRNGQLIGLISDPDIKPSSVRGSAESYHEHFGVRTEVQYNPICGQNNKQDEIMGIQQNKNQWKDNLPIPFTRLLKYSKKHTHTLIWKQWESISSRKERKERKNATIIQKVWRGELSRKLCNKIKNGNHQQKEDKEDYVKEVEKEVEKEDGEDHAEEDGEDHAQEDGEEDAEEDGEEDAEEDVQEDGEEDVQDDGEEDVQDDGEEIINKITHDCSYETSFNSNINMREKILKQLNRVEKIIKDENKSVDYCIEPYNLLLNALNNIK